MTQIQADSKLPLAGTRVLVTGAARRIGRGLALRLAEAGAEVAITYRGSKAAAEATVAEIGQAGVRGHCFGCDVTEEASVSAAVDAAVSAMGGLDLLINNAGLFETKPLEEISVAEWDAMFATNTRGPWLMARASLPHLRASGGRIVNIGSLGGMRPWPTHGHYCASKAALHMLSQTMAKAWAPEVSVNCVAPGMIVQSEVDPAYESFAQKTPMRRNGKVADVAEAVMFFATAPHFITGQLLAVDGGLGL
jgi:NAD(P)-dependent dehydrogenase (short-subunit alcohol dehydrogenase family)